MRASQPASIANADAEIEACEIALRLGHGHENAPQGKTLRGIEADQEAALTATYRALLRQINS